MSAPGGSYAVNPAAGFLWNVFFSSLGDPLGQATIDATGEKMSWNGPVWFQERTGTKNIRRVGFLFGAVTKAGGSALTVSLQNCSTAATASQGGPRPDETQDQTVAIANGAATFAANTWHRTGALSADRSVAFGEMLSVVVEFDGGGRLGADTVAFNNLATGEYTNGVCPALKTAGAWGQLPHYPNLVLEFDDGTFGTLQGGFPFSSLTNHAINLGTLAADEFALEFTVPVAMGIDGAGFLYARTSGGASNSEGQVTLYDSGGSTLASCQLRSIHVANTTGNFAYGYALFAATVALTAAATYRLAIKPTVTGAGNNITLNSFGVNDANHFRAHIGGTTWCEASRVDSGAWSTSPIARPFIWPILSLDTGGGAGDGGDIDPEPEFDNGDVTIGLAFMVLTARSGAKYAWSDRPLPDPSTYYEGWKEKRVTKWGTVRRALSSFDGQYETSDFKVMLNDTDRVLRQLDADKELVNATVAVYMVSDEDRRAELPARTIYRGVIRDAKPTGILNYELTIKDVFQEAFAINSDPAQVPDRTIGQTDFANCAVDLVNSSAEAYVCNGATAGGATTVPVKNGHGCFAVGDKVTFGGGAAVYAVTAASSTVIPDGLDLETSIDIEPALVSGVSNGDAVTQAPSHQVTASIGMRVPIVYGYITDRKLSGGVDLGDGQGPMIYVGDKVGADGKTYGEFLWAGHACYSPSNKPFVMLYFWNESLDDIGAGSFPNISTLASEAAVNGRVGIPGYGCWSTTLGIATDYRDYNSRRYQVLYLRGVFRDWALGIRPAPVNLGGAPFAVAAYGASTVSDGTGTLITSGLLQYKHILQNWIPPRGTTYQSGAWLATPFFADDPTMPMLDTTSFTAAEAQGNVYAGVNFRGDFIIGANNEAITRRELLARLNRSFGVDCGFNRNTQFFVSMVNTNIGTTTFQDPLTYVRDIFSGTWAIDPKTQELFTAIPYRHTQDYLGRVTDGWRSIQTGVLETEDAVATAAYGVKSSSPRYDMYMVRGNNRSTDPTDYNDGTATAAAVLALKLARVSTVQHMPRWLTGPKGFNYDIADVLKVTHYEGLSNVGWTDRPLRIERLETNPSDYTEGVESFDLDPMI